MSASTAATAVPTKAYNNRVFWDRLWRTSGINFVVFLLIAYVIYAAQPEMGASAGAVGAFYSGYRTRILIAAIVGGMAVLNLLWFGASLRTTLADTGQDGWGAAATAASTAVGGLLLLLIAIGAALAFSIAGTGSGSLTSALNDILWAGVVLSSFPRAMFVMSGSFGLWRAGVITNAQFGAGVAVVVLVLLGGTTWVSGGVWAPDGAYSRYVSPALGLLWVVVVSAILTKRPVARVGW